MLQVSSAHDQTLDNPCAYIDTSLRCFHTTKPALEVGNTFWKLRDSLVTCEFVILRALGFHVSVDHPHNVRIHKLVGSSAIQLGLSAVSSVLAALPEDVV